MAKPEAERGGGAGGGCWPSLLVLGVALVSTAALALCVVCLDSTRQDHIHLLELQLEDLQERLNGLQARLDNITVSMPATRKEAVYEEEVYEYDEDNSYEDEYDDEDEDEPVRTAKGTVKRTAVLGEGRLASGEERRARRDVRSVSVRDERLSETIHNPKKPAQGNQRTVDRDDTTPNYQEQRRAPDTTVRCRHRCRDRNRNAKFAEFSGEEYTPESQSCNILAAQFEGSTIKYNTNEHRHYFGNNILYHPTGLFEDWLPSDWVTQLNNTAHFHLHRGKLTIQKPGVYLIYAQVYYATIHDHSGFHIKHNGHEVAQCTTTTLSKTDRRPDSAQEWMRKRNTCFTAVALWLHKSDRLWLSEVEGHRNTSFRGYHSYFGLVQLASTPT